ncbi:hypothetical protein ABTJ52_21060, partial [Acinetobacter baumannii]
MAILQQLPWEELSWEFEPLKVFLLKFNEEEYTPFLQRYLAGLAILKYDTTKILSWKEIKKLGGKLHKLIDSLDEDNRVW